MPIHKLEMTGVQCGWAIWHITEREEELQRLAPEECPVEIHSQSKRLEWLAGRILAGKLLEQIGLPFKGISKDEFGKPFLTGHAHHVSLSHSFPFVAVQLDDRVNIGIDIEQPKEKLLRIGPRVLNFRELKDAGDNVVKHCVYWCAKEALYKIYGKRSLSFAGNLQIEPFALGPSGLLNGKVSAPGVEQFVTLAYVIASDFVLVYTRSDHE